MIDAEHIRIFSRFLNLAENDSGSPETEYAKIYIYKDGPGGKRQPTLSRGFTEYGGNLRKVVEAYIAKGGALADLFKSRLPKFGKGVLVDDKEFLNALVRAGAEQAMKDAQDEVFNEAYLGPALQWWERNGFKTALAACVCVDSFLHSGRMSPQLIRSFSERTPAAGGDERDWIKAYLTARLAWFQRSAGPLHTCMFRPAFFLGEIKKDNWDLNCPLAVSGKGKIC